MERSGKMNALIPSDKSFLTIIGISVFLVLELLDS
jgi:hypothetical protein